MSFHAEMSAAINSSNSYISEVCVGPGAVPSQEHEVIRGRLYRYDVCFRVPRGKPKNADPDVGAAVDNERLLPRVDYLTKSAISQLALGTGR